MTTTLLPQGFSAGLHYKPRRSQTVLPFNPTLDVPLSTQQKPSCLTCNQSLQLLGRANTVRKRNFAVLCSSVQPEQPLPPKPNFFDAWKSWGVGIFLSVVLPFSHSKWGPLLKLKDEVETTLQTAEDVVETVEKAAERVEKMAEDALDDLPDGGILKRVVAYIEKLAEFTAKKADAVDNVIDKVQELGEKLEAYMESTEKEETKEDAKEVKKDQK